MSANTLLLSAITVLLLGVAGCASQPPTPGSTAGASGVTVPAQWSSPDAKAIGAPQAPNWWRDFGSVELDTLVEQALKANRDLRIAAVRVEQARALVEGANAERLPQLALAGGLQRGRSSSADPKADVVSAGFRASWEVDLFGSKALASQAATGDAASGEFALQAARTAIAAEVAATYFELQGLMRRETVRQASVATLGRQIEVARRRFDAGATSQLDIDRLVGELRQERAAGVQLAGERRVRLHQLALLLGATQAPVAAGADGPDGDVAAPPPLLPVELLERRPDVQQQARALDAAAARAAVARRDIYPRLQIDWAGSRERMSIDGASAAPRLVVGYGVSLSMPLFDGGRIRANIAVREGQVQEAMAVYEKAMLAAIADAETALAQFATADATRKELEQALMAGNDAERRSERLFEAGLIGLDGVLDVRRSRIRTQEALQQARTARQVAAVAVRRAFAGAV